MRFDENQNQGVYYALDFTEELPKPIEYNMTELLKEKNGIPYQYVYQPEQMKDAMQTLFGWNYRLLKIQEHNGIRQDDNFYKLFLRNFIFMATSSTPIKLHSGKQTITYKDFIDAMNVIYHEGKENVQEKFMLLIDRCIYRYENYSKKNEISNPDALARTIIWSILINFEEDWNGWFNYDKSEEQGIESSNLKKRTNSFANFEQRDYSKEQMGDLEKILLNKN